MDSLKNLIARRRPSIGHQATEAPDTTLGAPHADLRLEEEQREDRRFKDMNEEAAKEARDRVPAPERPTADTFPNWDRPRTRLATASEPPAMAAELDPPTPTRKIWNLEERAPEEHVAAPAQAQELPSPQGDTTPPAASPSRTMSQRVKTRLIGFHGDNPMQDVFAGAQQAPQQAAPVFPIGWIVVVEGPGRGASFTLTAGLSSVGRDADQTVSLDFGDTAISRNGHVCIAYDEEQNVAYVGHGGKQNIVRINDKPLLSTEELQDGDVLKIGKTTLRFVGLCGNGFSWGGQAAMGFEDG